MVHRAIPSWAPLLAVAMTTLIVASIFGAGGEQIVAVGMRLRRYLRSSEGA